MLEESHVIAPTPEADLAVAAAMVEELETYIVNEDLYRTVIVRVPGSGDIKYKMTGGELLTRLHRLNGERARLTPPQQAQVDSTTAEAHRIIYSLKTRFHQRLQRELKSRLDSLRWFLDEASEDLARGRSNYPFQIRDRQRIEEIVKELGASMPPDLAAELASVDRRLRALLLGPEFVWDPALRDIFPQQPYWYLYARP